MTLHDTRTANTSRTSKGSSITSSSEQNDIKKLKSKYSAKLPTLKVLFADWSDEDLLFVLEEANGDLDLTIDRISEGHASQWGEVKTKKSKKEAQKAKAATTGVPSHNQLSTITPPPATSYRDTKPSQSRSYNDRPSRPGKATSNTSRTRSTKPSTGQSASWDSQPKQTQFNNDVSGGSWASIASLKQANDNNANDGWNPTATNNDSSVTDDWGTSLSTNTTSNTNAMNANPDESSEEQPKTWASLLKSKPKPEPEPSNSTTATTTENAFFENTTTNNNTSSEWDAPNTSGINDNWNANNSETTKDVDEWSTPVHESAPVEPSTTTTTSAPAQDESSWDKEEQKQSETDGWGDSAPTSEEKPVLSATAASETVSTTTPGSRLLNQEEPVKLPENASSAISSLDVKFGSLNVDEEPKKTEETHKDTTTAPAASNVTTAHDESAAADTSATAASTSAPSASIPAGTETKNEATASAPIAAGTNDTFGQTSSAYLKQQEPTATSSAYSQQQQQPAAPVNTAPLQQPQQQQQQSVHQLNQQPQQQQQIPQQFGMDHLTSAYSSYLPNQPPTGLSGFGMNPMSSLPDYGLYNTEAQRAAAMGYYDPTAFSHSPSVTSASAYGTRDKYSQDGLHSQTAQTQNMPQQQMYPTNLPYYQYYYMPNQFNAYQSAYGQPFVNKSMYPTNMYQQQQQQPGKPSTTAASATAASPYAGAVAGTGSVASPYGQQPSQLYNHQYDDLQQMGLKDYQLSSMYGNATATSQPHQPLQGFLGNLNTNAAAAGMGASAANTGVAGAGQTGQAQGAQPTTSQTAVTGAAGQAGQKTGTAGNASASTPHQQHQSNPQQHHHQQHQQPTHQQQPYGSNYFGQPMFSYGQYPHQFQQQMPPQQQQQQQQSQQPSRQQQYWAQ
ncbi:hypothetical protein BDF20DRAFT_1002578 [Mycotypha africana]|uniref:uncharacterized protein n=1 Tax=Mycotypha africana TaxID=64632 RepID=UPI002300BC2A|nr:uncharacterized protein BDF20DRAFT_1002578 [Mycotypha africana]KAI8973656.1 hypothetical protein BDF20DRAFT_1002578 [Mycotypha africana]